MNTQTVAYIDPLNGVSEKWRSILHTPALNDIYVKLNACLDKSEQLSPIINNIFYFARVTPYEDIRVVILGQDPYKTSKMAHGLAFSSADIVLRPASLDNIYKCLLEQHVITDMPTINNLESWSAQGVLLLNCTLTTIEGKSNAHKSLWREYTDKLIATIANELCPIFLLWGNDAKEKASLISGCTVMTHTHPSPLSRQSFTNCDHFVEVNKILAKPIDWTPVVVQPPKVTYRLQIDTSVCNTVDKSHIISTEIGNLTLVENKPENAFVSATQRDIDNINVDTGFGVASDVRLTVIFTDGSCYPNNKNAKNAKAGYAAAFVLGVYKDVLLYGNLSNETIPTNIRAEGYAILRTLQYLDEHVEWDKCIIVTDSEFWINMIMKYMPMWQCNGRSFRDQANSDITTVLFQLYNKLTDDDEKKIELRHVYSHNKSGWESSPLGMYKRFCYEKNKYADNIAEFARKSLPQGTYETGTIEYEKRV